MSVYVVIETIAFAPSAPEGMPKPNHDHVEGGVDVCGWATGRSGRSVEDWVAS
jgi:hypothetical protein